MHCSAKPCAPGSYAAIQRKRDASRSPESETNSESGRGVDQRTPIASRPLDHCLSGGNSLSPHLMTVEQRFDELVDILVAGLLRLRRQQSEKPLPLEKNGLDFSPDRSVHATARQRRRVRR